MVYYRRSKGLGLTTHSIWLAQLYFERLQSQLLRLGEARRHLETERARRLSYRREGGTDEYLEGLLRSKNRKEYPFYCLDCFKRLFVSEFEGCSVTLKDFAPEEGPDMKEEQDQGPSRDDGDRH